MLVKLHRKAFIFTLLLLICTLFGIVAQDKLDFLNPQRVEGNYDGLIKRYSGSVTKTLLRQGDKYLEAGKKQEAMVLYMLEMDRLATNLDSAQLTDHVEAFLKAGDIYYVDGNYPQALSVYIKALKISEKSPYHPLLQRIYKTIGNVYSMSQDYPRGIALYKVSVRKEPTFTGRFRLRTLQSKTLCSILMKTTGS